jgi:hypothetical protein
VPVLAQLGSGYEIGQLIGVTVRWAILIGVGVLVVRRMQGGQGRGPRSLPGQLAALVIVIAGIGYSIHYDFLRDDGPPIAAPVTAQADGEWLRGARAGMLSSCTKQGAPRPFCECYSDQLMERTGSRARIESLSAALREATPESEPPPLVTAAINACAPRGQPG